MPSKPILGISAFYHDSAAALVLDGEIIAAAQEERFSRAKHDPSFPAEAVRYVLSEGGISGLDELECISFYDKPYLKFERLLETYHAFAPRGLSNYLSAIPVWIKEKMFTRSILRTELSKIAPGNTRIVFPEHHLSHAASAFYPSPFENAGILTVDGVGEWATTTIGLGSGNRIQILYQLDFPHSLGLLYSAFTYYCGFKVNSGEYKLMGLAPYGNRSSEQTRKWRSLIFDKLVDLRPDGSFLLNMDYFDFATGLRMCRDDKWEDLFGIRRRSPETDLTAEHMNLALAIQEVTEEILLRLIKTVKAATASDHLVLAGGVALNCVANSKLLNTGLFRDIWIQPAAGDAGGALGAALSAHYLQSGVQRRPDGLKDSMKGSYLGPEFSSAEIMKMARMNRAVYTRYGDFDRLCSDTADLLARGFVVGWFQGRMEFGPRALGNRSILGSPTDPDMQKRLNLKIKYREGFRPFAPSVLQEDSKDFFELDRPSPYMLLVAPVARERRKNLPEKYDDLGLWEKLYHQRSDIQAVTHVDYSARIQTVDGVYNPKYHRLIRAFRERTGMGVLVNTSFNVRGEPIVCTPEDAYRCFMRTEMDCLVIGDFFFEKSKQPEKAKTGPPEIPFNPD